jgi:hypothetical protein
MERAGTVQHAMEFDCLHVEPPGARIRMPRGDFAEDAQQLSNRA